MKHRARATAIPIGLTLFLLAARAAAVPALSDPVNGATDPLSLSAPTLYLLFGPLFSLWDGISMLSMTRLKGFLLGLAILYLVWRVIRWVSKSRANSSRRGRGGRLLGELGVLAASLMLLLSFLVAGALWHRPMLSLTGASPNERVVDFHSHTNLSHDVEGTLMEGFDTEANLQWHGRAGFDAAFITDHNVVGRQSRFAGRRQDAGTVPCPGIEVSAWRAHIVLLGDTLPVNRRRYNNSLESLLQLLGTSERAYRSLSVASLPEYRRSHWQRLDTLVRAGLDGFEVVNASPKANELTRAERDSVILLAREHDRFVLGVSDSHGWGATSMVWNLVTVPPGTPGASLCGTVLKRLRDGFGAVRIVERHRLRPDSWWPMALTPVGVVWETWRSMGWALTASWLLWIWVFWGVAHRVRQRR